METPRQRAEALLKIHGGSCFVIKGNDLITPFLHMARDGLVTVSVASDGITIQRKDFTPTIAPHEEDEPPAH